MYVYYIYILVRSQFRLTQCRVAIPLGVAQILMVRSLYIVLNLRPSWATFGSWAASWQKMRKKDQWSTSTRTSIMNIMWLTSCDMSCVSWYEARPLRFDADFREERDIRFIWEDLIDGASLFVSVVQPDPPHLAFWGTVATVIVHQHQLPDRALCKIN